jgi:hypothetical protein
MTVASDVIERARAVPIESEIARRGIELKGHNSERKGPCPVCGGTDRFSINTKKQVWNCRGCSKGGDVIDLVMHVDGIDFIAAATTLAGEQQSKSNGMGNGKGHGNGQTFRSRAEPGIEVVPPDQLGRPPVLLAATIGDEVTFKRREVLVTANVAHEFVYYQGGEPVFIKCATGLARSSCRGIASQMSTASCGRASSRRGFGGSHMSRPAPIRSPTPGSGCCGAKASATLIRLPSLGSMHSRSAPPRTFRRVPNYT